MIGSAFARKILLMVPGFGGQVVGVYGLAQEIHRRLPEGAAVAIVDLDHLLHGVSEAAVCSTAVAGLEKIARALGVERLIGVVGFSLGGLLALQLARSMNLNGALPVWLLDAYAPRNRRSGFWRRVERKLAHKMWPLRGAGDDVAALADASSHDPNFSELSELPTRTAVQTWVRLMSDLGHMPLVAKGTSVQLIQARETVFNEGLIWRRNSSGFAPADYASFEVHTVDGAHLDLPRKMASDAATRIASQLTQGRAR